MDTLKAAWGAIRSALTRAKVTGAAMGTIRPVLQLQGYDGEIYNGVALLLPYGMTAIPPEGADVILARIAGVGNHKVALGGNDPSGGIADAKSGDVGWRAHAQQIVLRNGSVQILADGETLRQLVTDQFMALFNEHTHGSGPVPTQQMTNAHLTGAFQAGGQS